jgi:DNA-directed RNA polymerase subunit L
MDIEVLNKKEGVLEFKLKTEDHTMANLIRELSWKFKGEAAYKVPHPLVGQPVVKIVAEDPKAVLSKVSKEIVKLSEEAEKAF